MVDVLKADDESAELLAGIIFEEVSKQGLDDNVVATVARREAAGLIEGLKRDQQTAVRNLMARSIRDGLTEEETAEKLSRIVGLGQRYANAVENFRVGLVEKGTPKGVARQRANEYAQRLRNHRGATIYRTELQRVVGIAKRETWQLWKDEGLIDQYAVRVWHTHPDEKKCPECRPMNGQRAAIHKNYSRGHAGPPLHPNCRCWETLERGSVVLGKEDLSKIAKKKPAPLAALHKPGKLPVDGDNDGWVLEGTPQKKLAVPRLPSKSKQLLAQMDEEYAASQKKPSALDTYKKAVEAQIARNDEDFRRGRQSKYGHVKIKPKKEGREKSLIATEIPVNVHDKKEFEDKVKDLQELMRAQENKFGQKVGLPSDFEAKSDLVEDKKAKATVVRETATDIIKAMDDDPELESQLYHVTERSIRLGGGSPADDLNEALASMPTLLRIKSLVATGSADEIDAITPAEWAENGAAFNSTNIQAIASELHMNVGDVLFDILQHHGVAGVGAYLSSQRMVNQWAATSGDTHSRSLAMQAAAARKWELPDESFGHFYSGDADLDREISDFLNKEDLIFDAMLESMYKRTQMHFQSAGITHLTVARGVEIPHSEVTKSEFRLSPLSSTATHLKTSTNFGPTIMMMRVPRERILCSWATGMGCRSEHEFVIIGSNDPDKFQVFRRDQILEVVDPSSVYIPTPAPPPMQMSAATKQAIKDMSAKAQAKYKKFKQTQNDLLANNPQITDHGAYIGGMFMNAPADAHLGSGYLVNPDIEHGLFEVVPMDEWNGWNDDVKFNHLGQITAGTWSFLVDESEEPPDIEDNLAAGHAFKLNNNGDWQVVKLPAKKAVPHKIGQSPSKKAAAKKAGSKTQNPQSIDPDSGYPIYLGGQAALGEPGNLYVYKPDNVVLGHVAQEKPNKLWEVVPKKPVPGPLSPNEIKALGADDVEYDGDGYVTGGLFDHKPPGYLIAPGYEAVQNPHGGWSVLKVQKKKVGFAADFDGEHIKWSANGFLTGGQFGKAPPSGMIEPGYKLFKKAGGGWIILKSGKQ